MKWKDCRTRSNFYEKHVNFASSAGVLQCSGTHFWVNVGRFWTIWLVFIRKERVYWNPVHVGKKPAEVSILHTSVWLNKTRTSKVGALLRTQKAQRSINVLWMASLWENQEIPIIEKNYWTFPLKISLVAKKWGPFEIYKSFPEKVARCRKTIQMRTGFPLIPSTFAI